MSEHRHPDTVGDETIDLGEAGAQTVSPQPAPAPGGPEHRAQQRHYAGRIFLTRVSLPGTDISYFAWVHDVSETGIGLDLLTPLSPGTDIAFELRGTGTFEKVRVYAQVVHATPVGPFYRLGCRFTLPLRPSVLATIRTRMRSSDAEVALDRTT
jgi:hypothetical protein